MTQMINGYKIFWIPLNFDILGRKNLILTKIGGMLSISKVIDVLQVTPDTCHHVTMSSSDVSITNDESISLAVCCSNAAWPLSCSVLSEELTRDRQLFLTTHHQHQCHQWSQCYHDRSEPSKNITSS